MSANPAVSSVWNRLQNPVVLATEIRPQADGRVRRARLVRVAGKYPLLVFEGTLPAGQTSAPDDALTGAVARVADHVIVTPAKGADEAEFRQATAAAGLTLLPRRSPDCPFLARIPQASIDSVEKAIAALAASGSVASAEPDYLVTAMDIPEASVRVDVVDGHVIYPDSALDADTMHPPEGPVFDAATIETEAQIRLDSLPAGTRLIGFDPPGFLGGPSNYNPYLQEQNFLVTGSGGAYVQNAYTSGYPNNGSYYVRSPGTIRHREGLPFTILSIDLSEYSTVFTARKSVTFTGYKAGGGTVSQTFTTDGVIDGTGPLADFETFTFNGSFTNLTSVAINTGTLMADNIVLLVEGQESTPPAPPALPLAYDVTWDAPEHTADQLISVSGPFSPSSINFGSPMVRAQVGTLPGPAMELRGAGYQQVRFGLRRNADAYRLEFDAYLDLPKEFVIFFDGAGGVQKLNFSSGGSITAFQSYTYSPSFGAFPLRQSTNIAVNVDMVKKEWEVFVDGVFRNRGPFTTTDGDISDIRFHTSDTGSGSVGIDNVRVYAYGSSSTPATGPKLYISPPGFSFPARAVGSTMSWGLGLYNKGSQNLRLDDITSANSHFRVGGNFPVEVLPGGFYYADVEFQPQVTGPLAGHLTITSNDPLTPSVDVPVTGTGLGIPALALAPASLAVTMLADSRGTQAFTVTNSGSAGLFWNLGLKGITAPTEPPTDPSVTPDDPLFASLWAMAAPQAGRGGIDAIHAWSLTTGGAASLIAVIDTGVDRAHPELQGNLWVNPAEIPGNGIDDDKNGYIDDVSGWDFANGDNDPADGNGHGTHVAGTIAARGNNALGVVGVCWNTRILPIKFLSDAGSGYTSDAIAAVGYSQRVGARLSNNSWGGGGYSQALFNAIDSAGQAGSLFIAAAGNSNADNDASPHYPSSFSSPAILSVAATDQSDRLSYFSNYGADTVDLAAPGSSILSLRPGAQFAYFSGTSMATPHVTGAAGLLLSQNPTLTPDQLKQLLMFGSDSLAPLSGKVAGQGRLNVYRALKATVPQWLRPEITSGSVPPGGSAGVALSVDTSSLVPGEYHQIIAFSSNDPVRPVVDLPVNLRVIASQPFTQWLVGSFTENQMLATASESTLWSETADPDGDGLSNLLEYITAGNPLLSESRNIPAMVSRNGENLFEFRLRENLDGSYYRVEWSPDLSPSGWKTEGLVEVESSAEGMPVGVRRTRVRLTTPHSTAFFRVVGLPPE